MRSQTRRLGRMFSALVCAASPCAIAAQGCSSASDVAADGGVDSTAPVDATQAPPDDDGSDDVATPPGDDAADAGGSDSFSAADVVNCTSIPEQHEASLPIPEGGIPDGADADLYDPSCSYTFPCGMPPGVTAIGCAMVPADLDGAPLDAPALNCWLSEGRGCFADAYVPTESGSVTMDCLGCIGGSKGRWTAGLRRPRERAEAGSAGAYFARMAHDEAASVLAFARMKGELRAHGAPARLVRAAERSGKDEVVHARTIARDLSAHLARRGHTVLRGGLGECKRPGNLGG